MNKKFLQYKSFFVSIVLLILLSGVLYVYFFSHTHLHGKTSLEVFRDKKLAKLADAAARGNGDEVRLLVKQGVNPNALGYENASPLLWAMGSKNLKGFVALLEAGADPNISAFEGNTMVTFAAAADDVNFLKALIKYGGNVNSTTSVGDPAVLVAYESNGMEAIDFLVENGADINAQNNSHQTLLTYSAGIFEFNDSIWFINKGADILLPTSTGGTVSWYAQDKVSHLSPKIQESQARLKQLLIKKGVKFPFPSPFDVQRAMYGKRISEIAEDKTITDHKAFYDTKYKEFVAKIKSGQIKYENIRQYGDFYDYDRKAQINEYYVR